MGLQPYKLKSRSEFNRVITVWSMKASVARLKCSYNLVNGRWLDYKQGRFVFVIDEKFSIVRPSSATQH